MTDTVRHIEPAADVLAAFDWELARSWLATPPGDRLNIAFEAVDRHADGPRADTVAMRFLSAAGPPIERTYRQLRDDTDRFAAALGGVGLPRGARVATLLGRVPQLYVAALGALKYGAVYCPLFAAFGPEPVRDRLTLGEVAVLVTTAEAYARKVAPFRDQMPALTTVLVVDAPAPAGTVSWDAALAGAPRRPAGVAPTAPGDAALLHFTSGTTGRPKGALHVHEAVVAHHATAALALDLRPGDVYWCTADPGWVTGTSYGIVGPLTRGVTVVVDAGDFEARRWYEILAEQRVRVWYTAPTAIRMLMRAGDDLPKEYDLSALRHVASVGEPLNAEAVRWGERAIGLPIHDTWWQTETGAIMVANLPGVPIRPGSMGRPMPAVEAAVLERDENGVRLVDGHIRVVTDPEAVGELALRPGWPSMFREYIGDPARYAACFVDGWYLSGDLARRDADGYLWFVGRGDDVIKSAGHLVGPFEVESVLMEHPAVVEAGVIGTPDPLAGEVVKAFVTLRTGYQPDERLRRELIAFGRRRLGALAPRQIAFDQNLPHTRSGKVMRRLLKARELGMPEGDLSTVEAAP
ncbi:MAG TPA: acetate--CoA ligase [Jatrophihabitans sp.]|nr:acetate--CoA ligase [Jatrophihabitans sp.]